MIMKPHLWHRRIQIMEKTFGTMVLTVLAIIIGLFITAKYASSSEIARDGRFIAYENETVLDTRTNLMWAANSNGNKITWTTAKSYCDNYRGGGYSDWRMPTIDELKGLYDKDTGYLLEKVNRHVYLTKLINLSSWFWVWSSYNHTITRADTEVIDRGFKVGEVLYQNYQFSGRGEINRACCDAVGLALPVRNAR
jgi:hypothetical protein